MSLTQKILDIYAPPRCIGCNTEGRSLCHGCMADISTNHISRCFSCSKQTKDFSTCSKCRKKTPLKNVWVAVDYSGLARDLLHEFKYERERTAVRSLAELIDRSLPFLGDEIVITHVPTATSRVRARGYDHSLLLAKELARLRGLKHKTLLGRLGQTQQMGAKRRERLLQASGSYVATKNLNRDKVLIVDDVLTTGATLTTVAKELKKAGAKEIYATVVAYHGK